MDIAAVLVMEVENEKGLFPTLLLLTFANASANEFDENGDTGIWDS